MPRKIEIPNSPDYISVKEAAEIIGCSPMRVYQYIDSGLLSAQKVGRQTILPKKEVQQFRPHPSGRLRSKAPVWRTYRSRVTLFATVIQVQIRKNQQKELLKKLKAIRSDTHTFTGTIARYVLGDTETLLILLIWKDTEMPNEATRQQDLLLFQQEFADVLDWETAHICTKDVLRHT